jgi:beta-N-acetylhexosaminidase
MSPAVMGLLRGACGFHGPAISDDLEMAAVAAHYPLEEVVPGSVAAGVDALLVCHRPEVQHRAIDLLRAAVERGRLSRERLGEARSRVARLLSWAGPPPDAARAHNLLRRPEALALAARFPGRASGPDPTAA